MTVLSFREPVESLLNLQRELDSFLRRPLGVESSNFGVFPPINVFSDKDGLVVRAEVPGIAPDAVNVSVERNSLTITGERQPDLDSKGSFHRRERRFGKFSRSLHLPTDMEADKATAECRDGILTIRVPKRAEAKPKQVVIKAA
jgi:HSP20 family protein